MCKNLSEENAKEACERCQNLPTEEKEKEASIWSQKIQTCIRKCKAKAFWV